MNNALPPGDPGMQQKVKCLLVDDLQENLLALSALLRRDDVELLLARSGAEALDLLLSHEVALAILDVQMPEMDGFELAELMRGSERTRDVPLIFITAGAHDQVRIFRGYDSGAVDFLYKPVEPHILRSKADVFFQLHRQKRQLAHELRERTETLRLNEMFIAVLGHDLRTPLSAMLTSAHLLQRVSSEEMVLQAAGRILNSGRRMNRLIEDMLDLARARLAGGIPLRREITDLGALIHRVVQEHQGSNARRIDVVLEGQLMGEWDADRLTQLASNLIGNAVQHGQPDAPIEVRVDGSSPDTVMLCVRNAGAIPSDVLPQIFDPFRGGRRGAARSEGLGLGLYIVQQIVHAHRGSIEADTEGGTHTRFRVTIPRRTTDVLKL